MWLCLHTYTNVLRKGFICLTGETLHAVSDSFKPLNIKQLKRGLLSVREPHALVVVKIIN